MSEIWGFLHFFGGDLSVRFLEVLGKIDECKIDECKLQLSDLKIHHFIGGYITFHTNIFYPDLSIICVFLPNILTL